MIPFDREFGLDDDEIFKEMHEIESDKNGRQHCKLLVRERHARLSDDLFHTLQVAAPFGRVKSMRQEDFEQVINLAFALTIIVCSISFVVIIGVP